MEYILATNDPAASGQTIPMPARRRRALECGFGRNAYHTSKSLTRIVRPGPLIPQFPEHEPPNADCDESALSHARPHASPWQTRTQLVRITLLGKASAAVQNTIHNLDTKVFQNATGEFPAIVMGLNIRDAKEAEAFIAGAVEKWKLQRVCSPPDTANMTITVAGEMTAAQFRDSWCVHVARDPVLKLFMSMMRHASVLHIRGDELLDEATLLISHEPA